MPKGRKRGNKAKKLAAISTPVAPYRIGTSDLQYAVEVFETTPPPPQTAKSPTQEKEAVEPTPNPLTSSPGVRRALADRRRFILRENPFLASTNVSSNASFSDLDSYREVPRTALTGGLTGFGADTADLGFLQPEPAEAGTLLDSGDTASNVSVCGSDSYREESSTGDFSLDDEHLLEQLHHGRNGENANALDPALTTSVPESLDQAPTATCHDGIICALPVRGPFPEVLPIPHRRTGEDSTARRGSSSGELDPLEVSSIPVDTSNAELVEEIADADDTPFQAESTGEEVPTLEPEQRQADTANEDTKPFSKGMLEVPKTQSAVVSPVSPTLDAEGTSPPSSQASTIRLSHEDSDDDDGEAKIAEGKSHEVENTQEVLSDHDDRTSGGMVERRHRTQWTPPRTAQPPLHPPGYAINLLGPSIMFAPFYG